MENMELSKTGKYDRSRIASVYGYSDNKTIRFKYINGIYIDKFRSLHKRQLKLGKFITLITGKNGTMKSSILGLIAHPFTSPNGAKDMYGKDLKTNYSDVFHLSMDKDSNEYIYYLQATTIKDENIWEPVRIYRREVEERHRVTVGAGNEKGQGNFSLNTSYLNLKRLFPIIETKAKQADIQISDDDKKWIAHSYERIMQRSAYGNSEAITDGKGKNTLAPVDSYYDFNSISSGEDDLGYILCKMLAFKKNKVSDDCLQGLLCIDEVEASLHPSAQRQFLDFLLEWSQDNHIQVVVTSHSLYLLDYFMKLQQKKKDYDGLVIDNISTMQVGADRNFNFMVNPSFKVIRKELTYMDEIDSLYKVNIICEDEVAVEALKRIFKRGTLSRSVEYIGNLTEGEKGSPYNFLISLARKGQRLLEDSIIILDPDVDEKAMRKANNRFLLKIPEPDHYLLPLERRIVYYISQLDGSSPLFKEMEKSAIISTYNRYNIYEDNILNKEEMDVSAFKKWKENNKKIYNKALSQYIKDNEDLFHQFVEQVITLVNDKRRIRSLPLLEK